MGPYDDPERQRRGSCLTIMLTAGLVGFLLLLIVVATGGWAVHVVWIGAGIFLFGLIHYLLWGRLLLRQTAGEREEEEVRRQVEERLRQRQGPGSNGFRPSR
jgi:hypothetical protein